MASSSAVLLSPKDREPLKCVNDANFAVICAFLEKFGGLCAIEHPNFLDLQKMLESDEVHADLIDLHVKLLRKLKFSVNVERWERSLAKFCHTYSTNDAWELERFSYKLLKLPIRLRILKNLLETQFDNNPKFKAAVNVLDTAKLRPVPLGRDKMGNVYWRTLDADSNIRIYQENQDEESLRIVASNRDELAKLIAVLSGKEPMTPNLAGLVDEDSSSNSDIVTAPVAEEPKDNIVQKDEEEEEQQQQPPPPITPRPSETTSRITLLGKNNLDKINKFKMLNAKNKTGEEESEEDEEEDDDDDEEEEEEEGNYDTEDMDIEPEVVSSVIQERVVYIRGEGAGKSNKCGNHPLPSSAAVEGEAICGEAIEEPMMYFSGPGTGRECEGGNPADAETDSSGTTEKDPQNNRSEVAPAAAAAPPLPLPKPMFFFGRPGCLKLSPMKPSSPPLPAGGSAGDGATDEEADGAVENKKKLSLVAYDDSNSASSNSQESQGADHKVPEDVAVVDETSPAKEESAEVAVQVGIKEDRQKEENEDRVIQSTGVSEESTSETNDVVGGQCEVRIEDEVRGSEKADDAIAMLTGLGEGGKEMKGGSVLIPTDQEEDVCRVSGEVEKVTVCNEQSLKDLPVEVVPALKRDQEAVNACVLGAREKGDAETEETPFEESSEEMGEPCARPSGQSDENVVNLQHQQVIEGVPEDNTRGEETRQSDSLKNDDDQVDVPEGSCPPDNVSETTSANEVPNAAAPAVEEELLIDQGEQVSAPQDSSIPGDASPATSNGEDLLTVSDEKDEACCVKDNILEATPATLEDETIVEDRLPKGEEIVSSKLDQQNIATDVEEEGFETVSDDLPESQLELNEDSPAMKIDGISKEQQPPTTDTVKEVVVEEDPLVEMTTEEEESSSSLMQPTSSSVCTDQELQSQELHVDIVEEQEPAKDTEQELPIPLLEEPKMQSKEPDTDLVAEEEIPIPIVEEQEMQSEESDAELVEEQEPAKDPEQELPIPLLEEQRTIEVSKSSLLPVYEEQSILPQEMDNDIKANETGAAEVASELTVDRKEAPVEETGDENESPVEETISNIPQEIQEIQITAPAAPEMDIENPVLPPLPHLVDETKNAPTPSVDEIVSAPIAEETSRSPSEDVQTIREEVSPVIDEPLADAHIEPIEKEEESKTEAEGGIIAVETNEARREPFPVPTETVPDCSSLADTPSEAVDQVQGELSHVPSETVPEPSMADTPSEAVYKEEGVPVLEILPGDQEMPAAETPRDIPVAHPEIEQFSDEESDDDDGGHFDQDFNEPMDIEGEEEHDSEALVIDTPKPSEKEPEIHEEATESVAKAEVTESKTIINETPVKESKAEVPLDSDQKQGGLLIDDVPAESVSEVVVPEAPTRSDSVPTLVDVVPQPEESVSTPSEPPTRTRRGRRSDPVVAALGDTEILTETPRATRGRANQKESPKETTAPAKTPPQPRKNSRKRKSSESVAVAADVETKAELPKEEVVPVEIKNEDAPPAPAEITRGTEARETEVVKPIKHESEGDDEEQVIETTTGRRAPAKGKRGRKGRKAAVKKAVPEEAETIPTAEEATHVKEVSPAPEVAKEDEKPATTDTTPSTPTPEVLEETPKPKKSRRQNRMMGLYVDEIQPQEDAGSVRQSRRIAQIKIKEETDRRIQEEVALGKMKDSMKKRPESSGEEDSGSEKGGKAKGKGRKGKKAADKEKKVKSTWHSNSNTSEEDEKDEEEDNFGVVDEDPGSPLFKSDHEFSCESDVDGDEYVPTKMARTVVAKKKAKAASDDDSEEDNQDHACQKCLKHDHPEWILLCDTCDKGYHCSCLIPVLFIIPEGDWYCPQCQHAKLLEQLTSVLEQLDTALELKEHEAELLRRQAINNVCADNALPEDTVEPDEKRGKHQENRQRKAADDFSSDEDDSEEEKDSEDSDDLPIYKLRRRKQTKVSYRFNDYDELINKAIGHDMRDDRELNEIVPNSAEGATEEGKAGNLGRGKDISTIMEADDNEKTRKELSQSDASASDDEDGDDVAGGGRKKATVDDDSDGSEVVVRKNRNKHKGNTKAGKKAAGRKKNRKLNNLDSSSGDDGSDEDFEGSSAEDSEESAGSGSLDSDSSMELAAYRKRGKKNATARRSGRARVKRFDNDFINDNDDDDDDTLEKAPPVKRKKRKKEESDFSDFDEDDEDGDGSSDEMEEQDLDSADLCDDSESEDSEDRPWGSKKKKKTKSGTTSAKVFSKNPIMSAGKVPRNKAKRKPDSDEDDDDDDNEVVEDDEKPFKASVPKKKKKPAIVSEGEEEGENSTPAEPARPSRRTRGKKINFLEVVESGSSDDGIKPGVKRPDTPPEEREQFIKRQEEIKKMLAAKNTQAAINAATPKIEPLKLKLSGANASAAGSRQDPNSLSTIPRNIIQSAKALDTEFVKSRESGEEFDDELPDDFNPEDMDEEDLDRMMEEDGDFAVQQLKMASEAARLKKQPPQKLVVAKEVENKQVADKSKMGGSVLEPLPPISAQPPRDLLAHKAPPPGYPLHNLMVPGGGAPQPIPHSVIQGMPPRPTHLPPPPHLISDGQRHPHVQHPMNQMDMGRMPLMPPNMMGQGVPSGQMVGRFMHGGPGMPPSAAGPSGVPQNVIVGPQHLNMPPFPPYGAAAGPHPHPPVQEESPKSVPKKRGRKPKAAAAAPPPPVVAPLEVPMQVAGPPGEPGIIPTTVLAHEASSTPPKKGGGRRKKITPSREELQAAQAASAAASLPGGKREQPIESRGSILSERLEGGSVDPKQAPPVSQTLAAQPPYSGASVIQRLPQPGGGPPGGMMAGPYPGQGTPPRFYQHQGIGPPTPNAAALGMHHMQPHGNERMHFMQQHPRHMPPHMYRPPSSIYGNPYQGQHAPPPHLQRPQMDPHGGVRPMHPQDYSNSYLPPQFGPYIPGHPPNTHIRGPVPPSAAEDAKGKKGPPPPAPGPPHPSQLAHYEALKAAGGAHYNAPYPGPHPGAGMRHPGDPHAHPDAPNPGEFSGLVSYFSAQHDDLEQQ